MLKLLYKTIGISFYQQHAGLFLVVIYLLFGAVEGSQLISYHKAILQAICTSPIVLVCIFLIWTLYALKAFLLVKQKIKAPEYQFLTSITSISRNKQFLLWIKLYVFLLLPILIYSLLILGTSIKINAYFTCFFTLIVLIALIIILSSCTFWLNNYTFISSKKWITIRRLNIKRPFWTWPLHYLFNEQWITLMVVKGVSIFFFKAVLFMFADVGNDVRVYLTAILAVVLSHAVLVFNLVKFDAFYLSFAKTLPITAIRNLMSSLIVYGILLIPEFIVLSWLIEFQIFYLLSCILFGISLTLALQQFVYMVKADMDRYLRYILMTFFVTMWVILAGYAIVYSILLMLISGALFLFYYPKIDFKTIA